MYIDFNKQKLHVQVICGTLEEYAPTPEMKEIHEKVEALKAKLAKFQTETEFPEIEAIDALVAKINPKPSEESV